METKKLVCFMAVAAEGNLTRAAKSLFMSQSALSGQLKQLEDDLGYPVFIRRARGMDLSPEGENLLPFARRAMRAMEEFEAQAAGLRSEMSHRLTVGLNTDPVFLRMGALSAAMSQAMPETRLSFTVSESRFTARLLRDGEMDVGFRFGTWGEEGINDEFVASVELGIAIPSAMSLNLDMTDWRALAALPWIYIFRGCPFHKALRERMSAFGVEPKGVANTVDENIMRELVGEGVGVATLRMDDAMLLKKSGKAVLWPETLHVPLCLSFPVNQGYSTPLREFREVVRSVWDENRTRQSLKMVG